MLAVFRTFALVALVFLMAAQQAQAISHDGHGPDWWRVRDVASWDVLNVRNGPGVAFDQVDALHHNARRVQVVNCVEIGTSRGPATWCLVNWQGFQRGWVNSRFLGEDF